jgi:hypothetical protein
VKRFIKTIIIVTIDIAPRMIIAQPPDSMSFQRFTCPPSMPGSLETVVAGIRVVSLAAGELSITGGTEAGADGTGVAAPRSSIAVTALSLRPGGAGVWATAAVTPMARAKRIATDFMKYRVPMVADAPEDATTL